jgi:ferric-dicitrate binding protein FerR (iron transport regulator)
MQPNTIIPLENEIRMTAFLNKEPENSDISNLEAVEMDGFIATWETIGTGFCHSAANPDKAWANLKNNLEKPDSNLTTRILRSPIFRIAAMFVLVAGIGFVTYKTVQSPPMEIVMPVKRLVMQTEIHPATLTVVSLPDGSVVKLNAGTRIEYPESFGKGDRKVKLAGEAFFNVTRDTLHPFVIETEHASVEVLGTSFNVSAYPDAKIVEVQVETGKVKLTQFSKDNKKANSAILPAGEHGWLNIGKGELGQMPIQSKNYSSWMTKKISFQRTPLAEAFLVLENTYHVSIVIDSPEIGQMPYTANFADLQLDYIINVIARTHRLKATRNGDEIVFTRR